MDFQNDTAPQGMTLDAPSLQAFASDMIGAADCLELLAKEHAARLTGVATEMANQIRDRASAMLAQAGQA